VFIFALAKSGFWFIGNFEIFHEIKLLIISGTRAATWHQKLTADLTSL
jgi:hypothetical protein